MVYVGVITHLFVFLPRVSFGMTGDDSGGAPRLLRICADRSEKNLEVGRLSFWVASGFVLEGTCMDNNYMIKHGIIFIYIYMIYI